LEHLLSQWPRVQAQISQAKRILLLTDYDGTLAPIVERPELAEIPESTRQVLKKLARQRTFKLGIISGRGLADLKSKVKIRGLIYAGNHGFEIRGPGLNFVNPLAKEIRPFLRVVSKILTLALETTKGVFVEDKGLTLSVHYRQMAGNNSGDENYLFDSIMRSARDTGKFKVTAGKKVYELRPAIDWDKGKAIEMLIKKYGHKNGRKDGLLPVYIGDDVTDEDGFKVVRRYRNGLAIHVGENIDNTAADYFLKSPEEVAEFLKKVQDNSEKGLN
jgi:trehalose 6-phosphate phosphatase